MNFNQEYLGDGLYVEDKGSQFRLYTNGSNGQESVYLDNQALRAFFRYIEIARNVEITVKSSKTIYSAPDLT